MITLFNTRRFAFRKACIIVFISAIFISSSCHKEIIVTEWYPPTSATGDSFLAAYESRIPCGDCERLKFALVVYGDIITKVPSSYMMARVYVGKNNDRIINSGIMSAFSGTVINTADTVYRLDTNAPDEYKLFWRINNDLLFILNDNLTPKVGDAGHGYALNRVK